MKLKKAAIVLLRKVKKKILDKPRSFEMSSWVMPNNAIACGTTGCIAGWVVMLSSPGLQDLVRQGKHGYVDWRKEATKKLGIESAQAASLFLDDFWPWKYGAGLIEAGSNKQKARVAANRIEHFIRTGK